MAPQIGPTIPSPLSGGVTTLNLSSNMARHAAQRHALISQNIANADTPGYRARDLQSFSAVMASAQTDPAGLSLDPIERTGLSSPNGNTVSLEDELMQSAQVQQDYNMAIQIYKTTLQMMKMSIGKNL